MKEPQHICLISDKQNTPLTAEVANIEDIQSPITSAYEHIFI